MSAVNRQLIVNHVQGEETRIALLENGRLEEIYSEHGSSDFHVGNIYLGRVTNVESSIQAAFIDFGVGRNGFLHVSDVHPMFFPGQNAETTEAVGQKTPHRQRPPIQRCLSRGQEIMVQVLKEGIGTKGPTLTSYISIPGRFLVMMPNMEQLGVSRKVEDLEQRREMRKILDSLDLPKDFGFILRTAGMQAGKTELKRDLAYLQRLWKSIESQRQSAQGPTRLYVESDLLTRTVRDLASMDLNEIVVDDKAVVERLRRFMRLVSPRRKGPEIKAYIDQMPIFHRYNIEMQMRGIHARQVPLPGGGSIVIDSAEAMVVIDVNSGKMRQFRNAEATAFQTNLEAIDEICRQLRLRDLGGIVVIDTIDMISNDHRKQVEGRLRDNLKRDRAKTEFLRISNFGLIQMTRQRVRSPLRKTQFSTCPTCEGRGVIQTIEATAVDALRDLTYWSAHPQVASIDMVVSSALANLLISKKRRQIAQIERSTGKSIEIRVGADFPAGRVDFYAYDAHRTDLDLSQLATTFPAQLERALSTEELEDLEDSREALDEMETVEDESEPDTESPDDTSASASKRDTEKPTGRRRSRRRRRRSGAAPDQKQVEASAKADETAGASSSTPEPAPGGSQATPAAKKSRRRRSKKKASTGTEAPAAPDARLKTTDQTTEQSGETGGQKKAKSRRRRSGRKPGESQGAQVQAESKIAPATNAGPQSTEDDKSRSSRRRRKKSRTIPAETKSTAPGPTSGGQPKPAESKADGAPAASRNGTTDEAPRKKKSRRRRRSKAGASASADADGASSKHKTDTSAASARQMPVVQSGQGTADSSPAPAKPRRTLYGNRRKLKPSELAVVQSRNED